MSISSHKARAGERYFRAQGVRAMDLFPPRLQNDAAKGRRVELIERLGARLSSIPGVERVGFVGSLPLGSDMANGTFIFMEGDPAPTTIPEFQRLSRERNRT